MSVARAVADTGLDLKNAELVIDTLAPDLGARVGETLADIERGVAVVRSAAATIMAATTPAAAVAAVAMLAALSKQANFSVCCYCENPSRCHRSLLGELLREQGGNVRPGFR